MKYKRYILRATESIPELEQQQEKDEEKDDEKKVPTPSVDLTTVHVISLLSDTDGEVSDSETDVDVDVLFNSDDGEDHSTKKDV